MNGGFILPDWPAPNAVRAISTTRMGGHSAGPYAGFNLATHVGDDPAVVAANRRQLSELAGLPNEPHWLEQTHGVRCVSLDAELAREADASVTGRAGSVCAILTADCLPVLLCNDAGTAVAAAHAGWRGLAGGVLESAVAAIGGEPRRLLAWLGPAIGPRAFEVGAEVRAAFVEHDPRAAAAFVGNNNGKWLCDLYMLARQRLNNAGVIHVHGGGWCTFSDAPRFFSYRRDGRTGRMATLIWLDSSSGRV